MKKFLTLALSSILLASMAVSTAALEKDKDYIVIEEFDPDNYAAFGDAYPASEAVLGPAKGEIIKGTVIAAVDEATGKLHSWVPDQNASKLFDGDNVSSFDAFESSEASWAGLILDQPYELTEVRVHSREANPGRLEGITIQGSNDGENWTNIVYYPTGAEEFTYHAATPGTDLWVGEGAYSMYKMVNTAGIHCNVVELELYGYPEGQAPSWEKGKDYIVLEEFDPDNYAAFGDAYPASEAVLGAANGEIIKGTVISAVDEATGKLHSWVPDQNASKLFDGDNVSSFDAFESSEKSWAGLILDQPYELTEVRVHSREANPGRLEGITIQGSNDGINWTNIVYYPTGAEEFTYHAATPGTDLWVGEGAYSMYKMVNTGGIHCNVVELELYGYPEGQVPTAAPNDEFTFNGTLVDTGVKSVAPFGLDNVVIGTVMGAGDTTEGNVYANAFDGDMTTKWEAAANNWSDYFITLKADEAVVPAGFVISTRVDENGAPTRFHAIFHSNIQASNDGVNWVTLHNIGDEYIWYSEDYAEFGTPYYIIVPETEVTEAYTYFRYGNNDDGAAELSEFAVLTALPGEDVDAPADNQPEAPQTFDAGIIAAAVAVVSAAGYAISKKRR